MKILYFSAEWCSGCKAMMPKFIDKAKSLNIDFKILDVEEDDNADMVSDYRIKSLPTLVFLKDGNEIGRATGSNAYMDIDKYIGQC